MTQARARGRRPGTSTARDDIAAAARTLFAELGYPRTTVRAIAQAAGVDARLVSHYFGSKQELFVDVLELPFEPQDVFERVYGPGPEGAGRRLAEFIVTTLDLPEGRQTVTGLLRAAASEEEAAAMIRDVLMARILGPLTARIGSDDPELRAQLVGSQIAGLAFARHVVGLPRLAQERGALVAALAPVLQHYLTGDLRGTPDATTPGSAPALGETGRADAEFA